MKALPARSWYYYIKVTGDGRGIGCHHIWGIDMYVCIEKRHFLCMLQVFKLLTMRFFCSLDVTWFLHFYTSDKQPQCFPHRRSYSGILTTTQVYLSYLTFYSHERPTHICKCSAEKSHIKKVMFLDITSRLYCDRPPY